MLRPGHELRVEVSERVEAFSSLRHPTRLANVGSGGTEASGAAGGPLASPLDLPCGLRLENRLAKAAMSDSLGDGAGQPTDEQIELYRRWAHGGVGLSIIGEVQVDPRYPEKPGNLVLGAQRDKSSFQRLAGAGSEGTTRIWPQLGHAGALAHAPISRPAGPSALDIGGLRCAELSVEEIEALPSRARIWKVSAAAGATEVFPKMVSVLSAEASTAPAISKDFPLSAPLVNWIDRPA